MRMDSLEAVAQVIVGNPVLKEVLDKLEGTRLNVSEVNHVPVKPQCAFAALTIAAATTTIRIDTSIFTY